VGPARRQAVKGKEKGGRWTGSGSEVRFFLIHIGEGVSVQRGEGNEEGEKRKGDLQSAALGENTTGWGGEVEVVNNSSTGIRNQEEIKTKKRKRVGGGRGKRFI